MFKKCDSAARSLTINTAAAAAAAAAGTGTSSVSASFLFYLGWTDGRTDGPASWNTIEINTLLTVCVNREKNASLLPRYNI